MLGGQIVRAFSRSAAVRSSAQSVSGGEHAEKAMKLWRNVSLFVAFPAIVICGVNAYLAEKEHMEHFHRPEFIPYEHLRLRTKKFPWGDGNHSLFHNPRVNPLPDGYED